ncbi:MAG: hypothetical protein RJA36_887 [Pseudomonadota bacterium]|jgi:DNA modification methylase
MNAPVIKKIPVAALVPYERNARTHSPEQVEQIARSIREFGFTSPLLVDEQGRIIAGHGRLLALRSLGETEASCIVLSGLTDAQRRALVIADNKLALNAGWDTELLVAELKELQLEGFDVSLTGFSAAELAEFFLELAPDRDPDEVPELPAEPVTKPGDVWRLGAHLVICGDSTDVCTLGRVMGNAQADAVICAEATWTDPPYNVAYETKAGKIANDDMKDGEFLDFLTSAFSSVWTCMKPGAAIYVAHADGEPGLSFRTAFRAAGFKLSGCLIWRKDKFTLSRSDYQWQHEPILYGWKPGSAHRWYGGRKETTVWDLGDRSPFVRLEDGRWQLTVGNQTMIVAGDVRVSEVVPTVIDEPKPKRNGSHPTMKPVALIERMLKHSARPGDLILDPFGGSGSTLIAADRLGMEARLCELDPRYVDVIVKRWEDYTGRKAVLETTHD